MTTATQLTVSEAAQHVGVTRQTIFKAVKTGKLSATQNKRGHLQINVVELLRVYGELQSPEQVAKNTINNKQQLPTLTATAALQLDLERMKLQLQMRDFELQKMREHVDELKKREQQANEERLRMFGLLEQQTRLLAAPVPSKAPAKPRTAAKRAAKPTANTVAAKTIKKPTAASKATPKSAVKKATTRTIRSTPAVAKKTRKK